MPNAPKFSHFYHVRAYDRTGRALAASWLVLASDLALEVIDYGDGICHLGRRTGAAGDFTVCQVVHLNDGRWMVIWADSDTGFASSMFENQLTDDAMWSAWCPRRVPTKASP